MYGDPHLQTLDGVQYTFNGRGEFILVQTIDNRLTVQGRMIPIATSGGASSNGTVFSAIVAKQDNSDTVEFQYSFIGLRALVNGDWVIVESDTPAQFNNVAVRNKGSNTYGAVFTSGAYIEVKQENGYLALVSVSLPDTYKGVTDGLLGHFDGMTQSDLVPRTGGALSRNPSMEDIHFQFGLTCKILLIISLITSHY